MYAYKCVRVQICTRTDPRSTTPEISTLTDPAEVYEFGRFPTSVLRRPSFGEICTRTENVRVQISQQQIWLQQLQKEWFHRQLIKQFTFYFTFVFTMFKNDPRAWIFTTMPLLQKYYFKVGPLPQVQVQIRYPTE